MAKKNLSSSKQFLNSELKKGIVLGVAIVFVVWFLMGMMLQKSAM